MTLNESCIHERTIGSLQASYDALRIAINEIKEGQKEAIRTLEKIAAHETKVRVAKLETDQEEVFIRLRKVELDANTVSAKISMYAAGVGAGVAALIHAGLRHL